MCQHKCSASSLAHFFYNLRFKIVIMKFAALVLCCIVPLVISEPTAAPVTNPVCYVCGGQDIVVTVLNATVALPGEKPLSCQAIQAGGLTGLVPAAYCSLLLGFLDVCKCTPKSAPVSPTVAPVAPSAAPVKPSAAPVTLTRAPVKPTAAPVTPTLAPVKPTAAPVKPTAAPVKPTSAPVKPTPPPSKPTLAPVKPSPAPTQPVAIAQAATVAPVKAPSAPVKPVSAPVEPTSAPVKSPTTPVKAPSIKPSITTPIALHTAKPIAYKVGKKGKLGMKKTN